MRIISGKFKGKRLVAPEGTDIRPTTDRMKESLFNILAHASWFEGGFDHKRVMDIFCGSGSLGLEALSRGAQEVVFIDKDRRSLSLCQQNVDLCEAKGQTQLIKADFLTYQFNKIGVFDLIFADPPYGLGLEKDIIEKTHNLLMPDGILCLEVSSDLDPTTLDIYPMQLKRQIQTAKSQIVFLALQ